MSAVPLPSAGCAHLSTELIKGVDFNLKCEVLHPPDLRRGIHQVKGSDSDPCVLVFSSMVNCPPPRRTIYPLEGPGPASLFGFRHLDALRWLAGRRTTSTA